MKSVHDIILKPVVTEHSMALMREQRKYTFIVAPDANKIEIKEAVEKIFSVKVASVNTINFDGKERRMGYTSGKTASGKRAIVTLTADSKSIEFFDSLM